MLVLSGRHSEVVVVGGTSGLDDAMKAVRGEGKPGLAATEDALLHRAKAEEQIIEKRPEPASSSPRTGLDQWADDGGPEPEES